MRWWFAAALLVLLPVLAACGKKGPPRPPMARFPVQSAPPQARQVGDRLEVRIPLPGLAAGGEAVERLSGLKLYRIERALVDSGALPVVTSRDFRDTLRPIRTLEGEEAAALTPGGVLIHEEPLPPSHRERPRALAYAVRFRGVGRAWSPPFTVALVVPAESLGVPAPLTATAEPGGVRLIWAPAAGRIAVFRGEVGSPLDFLPVSVVDAGVATYLDDSAAADATYEYALRAVAGDPAGHAYGAVTTPVRVAVLDTFAPLPPRGLAALARIGGVDLFWQAGDEEDLAGYRVWRRVLPDGEWTVVTPEPLARTNWSDFAVVEGARYLYAVTAVDDAPVPNESLRSDVEQVSVPYAPQRRDEAGVGPEATDPGAPS